MIPQTNISNARPRTFNALNTLIKFYIFPDEMDGKMCIFEAVVPAGIGAPPHSHVGEAEAFFILDGTVRFRMGAIGPKEIVASPGDFVAIPDGAIHSFVAETDAKVLVINTPGHAHADFFTAIGEVVPDAMSAPLPPTPPNFEAVARAAETAGITLVG